MLLESPVRWLSSPSATPSSSSSSSCWPSVSRGEEATRPLQRPRPQQTRSSTSQAATGSWCPQGGEKLFFHIKHRFWSFETAIEWLLLEKWDRTIGGKKLISSVKGGAGKVRKNTNNLNSSFPWRNEKKNHFHIVPTAPLGGATPRPETRTMKTMMTMRAWWSARGIALPCAGAGTRTSYLPVRRRRRGRRRRGIIATRGAGWGSTGRQRG